MMIGKCDELQGRAGSIGILSVYRDTIMVGVGWWTVNVR